MSINGKFDGITLADLKKVGDQHLVPNYMSVLDEVFKAIDTRLDFARSAGVSGKTIERVAKDIGLNRRR